MPHWSSQRRWLRLALRMHVSHIRSPSGCYVIRRTSKMSGVSGVLSGEDAANSTNAPRHARTTVSFMVESEKGIELAVIVSKLSSEVRGGLERGR